jgi:ubiquinone/menaquinone biosynthesis C-methylase UbiE
VTDLPTWSSVAGWYDELVASGSGPHETALACSLQLAGDVSGLELLDLACGTGLASRALAGAGAGRVSGVDSAAPMIGIAREYESREPLGVRYFEDDAQRLTTFEDATFDGATCQLGLMDIPDLTATLAAVHRVLRMSGWFVFVIGHPAFLAPYAVTVPAEDDRPGRFICEYLDEHFWRSPNPQGVRRVGNHHRTISTYMNATIAGGFAIEAVAEPPASPMLADQQPEYVSLPILLGVRARKR